MSVLHLELPTFFVLLIFVLLDWKKLSQRSPWWWMKKLLLFWSNLEQESLMFFEVIIFLIIMVKHKEKTMVGRGR
jgi:hypothetical protein